MIKVMVIDHNTTSAVETAEIIHRTPGFVAVGAAHSGASARLAARRLRPDVVLLDTNLPDGRGLDLLSQLRLIVPDLDAIIATATRDTVAVRQAARSGILHYLIKPFRPEDLRRRLDHYRYAYGPLRQGLDHLEQAHVDRALGIHMEPRQSSASSNTGTLQRMVNLVESLNGDLSSTEAAEQLGISRTSARRYLEYLHGTARVELRLRYGSGRPQRRYARCSSGEPTPTRA